MVDLSTLLHSEKLEKWKTRASSAGAAVPVCCGGGSLERELDAAARSNESFDGLVRLVALPDERVVDDANVKKDASELVGLDTSDEPSESGSVLRACVAPRTSRTISAAL